MPTVLKCTRIYKMESRSCGLGAAPLKWSVHVHIPFVSGCENAEPTLHSSRNQPSLRPRPISMSAKPGTGINLYSVPANDVLPIRVEYWAASPRVCVLDTFC